MAGSLAASVGVAFSTVDVVTAFRQPLTPETRVLDRYVFLPHARTGIAGALSTPFAFDRPASASVTVRVPVVDDTGEDTAEMTVHVHGPGDVTEIDRRQVIRTHPRAGVTDAEVDDLVHVEFDRPDLPWLFTPTGPDAAGHLVPWITLVVAERRHLAWRSRGATSVATVRRDQLQPLTQAWAWAHAQVMGWRPGAAGAPPGTPPLEQRLGEANAAHNLSRLVCPRRLATRTSYVAAVVPTFAVGRDTGLGLAPTTTVLAPSWEDDGDPAATVDLPVYVSWEFTTGEEGNFESLARLVLPRVAPPGVGRRRVDTSSSGVGPALAAADPGAEMVVRGPVVSLAPAPPGDAADPPERRWPDEAAQQWPASTVTELRDRLGAPDRAAHEPTAGDPAPPLVGPTIYGDKHAGRSTVDGTGPAWFEQVNTDPRHRIVAGLGTRVVAMDQEDLMAAAWNQVAGIETANQALRLAQLAAVVNASLHRRHISRLSDAAVLSVTERVHAKVHDPGDGTRTVWATVGASSLPPAVTTGAFRRLVRVRGPVVRHAVTGPALRRDTVAKLMVAPDRSTRNWVARYAAPDGAVTAGPLAASLVTDEVAARVRPGVDAGTLLARWSEELPRARAVDGLTQEAVLTADLPSLDLREQVAAVAMTRLLSGAPSFADIDADPVAATTAATIALAVVPLANDAGTRFALPTGTGERLELEVDDRTSDGRTVIVRPEAVLAWVERVLGMTRRSVGDRDRSAAQEAAGRLAEFVRGAGQVGGGSLREGLLGLAGAAVPGVDPFADPPRPRIDAPSLSLVAALDPAVTVPARIRARLGAGSGALPGWVRPGWFDEGRVAPVMATPRFAYPMYEPLDRYDRNWMVPGLALIERPDMVTLLETNNAFVEAYLVGLNHEMGRELLWREYPTDQRGTPFSSFWTRRPELVADLHETPWRTGDLGAHVTAELAGQIVLLVRGQLVRRYPGVVAHALRQAATDRGVPVLELADPAPVETLFQVRLAPDVLLVGFGVTQERLRTPGETWWFTMSENPTEPRLGLDPPPSAAPPRDPDGPPLAGAASRNDLTWLHVPRMRQGRFLDAGRAGPAFDGSTWGASSADVGHLLFQLPARAAYAATSMLGATTPGGG